MNELLKYLFDPEVFSLHGDTLGKKDFEQDSDGWEILQCLRMYFADKDGKVTPAQLLKFHTSQFKNGLKPEHKARLEARYKEIEDTEATDFSSFYFNRAKKKHDMLHVQTKLAAATAKGDMETATELVRELAQIAGQTEDEDETVLLPMGAQDILKSVQTAAKYRWFLPPIEQYVKGFGPGRSLLLAARTSVGKTSFLAGAFNGFLKQGARVLDVTIAESEDPHARTLRHIQAEFNVPDLELMANFDHYHAEYSKRFQGRLARMDAGHLTPDRLLKAIREFRPDIVSVDNFTKMQLDLTGRGMRELNHPKAMGMVLHELKAMQREFEFGLIAICQAAVTAEGKHKLDVSDLQDSKTDVPGEMQTIMCLARGEVPGLRYVSFPKNKPDSRAEAIVLPLLLNETTCSWTTMSG